MKRFPFCFSALAVLVLLATMAQADSITHGTTTINMDFVTVGNPGNAGEWSGESYGGYGPDAICGTVDYTYNTGHLRTSQQCQ